MNPEQYLSQLRNIRKWIENKKKEAKMWHDIAEGISVSVDADRVQTSPSQDRMAEAVSRAIDYEREAEALTWRLINLQHDIIYKLDHMPTVDYGILLSEYFVHDMTLVQISREWGVSYRHIRRMKDNALVEFGQEYGKSPKIF